DRPVRLRGVHLQVAVAAFCAEAIVNRDRLKQGGLSRAVLAGEEADSGVQRELIQVPDHGNAKWIALPIPYTVPQQRDLVQHGISSTLADFVARAGLIARAPRGISRLRERPCSRSRRR